MHRTQEVSARSRGFTVGSLDRQTAVIAEHSDTRVLALPYASRTLACPLVPRPPSLLRSRPLVRIQLGAPHHSYHYLIAIITADSSAPFTICKNRAGDPLATWAASAGSLVLLRAPGLDGVDDGRPLHAVSGPEHGQRISVSYRMDTTTPA
jgi:hypothetical protein